MPDGTGRPSLHVGVTTFPNTIRIEINSLIHSYTHKLTKYARNQSRPIYLVLSRESPEPITFARLMALPADTQCKKLSKPLCPRPLSWLWQMGYNAAKQMMLLQVAPQRQNPRADVCFALGKYFTWICHLCPHLLQTKWPRRHTPNYFRAPLDHILHHLDDIPH